MSSGGKMGEEKPQIKLNGSVYEISREISGLGFWYTFNTPAKPRELPREIYLFQIYINNGKREVIAFETPSGRPEIRKILKNKLEGCVKEFPICEACSNMPCEG